MHLCVSRKAFEDNPFPQKARTRWNVFDYFVSFNKKARVYRPEDFKEYEREEGVIKITKPAAFIVHLNKDF